MALRTISLCSGGGGLDLGLDAGARRAGLGGARAVCMVEGEAFAVATLAAQMEQGGLAPAPIWSDLRTFDARPWRGVVDCVAGGYPCQPFSLAGHRLGDLDDRHLWPDIVRILRDCEPAWCFFENVSGHLSLGGHDVIRELQAMGFCVACSLWTAEEVGAPHRRERLFILAAHPERICLRVEQGRGGGADGAGAALARERGEARALPDSERITQRDAPARDAEPGESVEPLTGRDGASWDVADADRERGEARSSVPEPTQEERARPSDGGSHAHVADAERDVGDERRPGDASEGARGWDAGRSALGPDHVAHADHRGELQSEGSKPVERRRACDGGGWAVEPDVGRVAHGVAARVERLRLLGNGVVPEQAACAFVELYDALTGGG